MSPLSNPPAPRFPPRADWLWFCVPLAVYLALHLLFRLALGTPLEKDEAEQFVLAQHLAWGYSPQPPLYTWLFWGFAQILGPTLFALTLLKTLLFAAAYALTFACARTVITDRRLALLATFSIILAPTWTWDAMRDGTHSLLLVVMGVATLYVALRLPERRTLGRYALLGLLVALGTMSKYNFLIFAAALLLAGLTVARFRTAILDPRILVTAAIALLVIAPHAWWVFAHWEIVSEFLHKRTGMDAEGHPLGLRLAGLRNLAWGAFLILCPLVFFLLVFFPRAWLPQGQSAVDSHRLLGRFLLATCVLLVGVVLAGATYFLSRWLQVFLPALPIYFFARLQNVPTPRWRLRAYAGMLLAVALTVLVGRATHLWDGIGLKDDELAIHARQVCGQKQVSVIVTEDHVSAGNLRLQYPDTPVLCMAYPSPPPVKAKTGGHCLVVWKAWGKKPSREVVKFVEAVLGLRATTRSSVLRLQRPNTVQGWALGFSLVPNGETVMGR